MKKKNKGLIVVVIILALCVLGLLGYIIWNKVLDNSKSSNPTDDSFPCDGCDPSTVRLLIVNSIEEIEERLGIKVPTIFEERDDGIYTVSNDGWPLYASINYGDEFELEIAKEYDQLSIPNRQDSSSVKKITVTNIEVTIWDTPVESNVSAALWQYKDFYYAFAFSPDNNKVYSPNTLEESVNQLIAQMIGIN